MALNNNCNNCILNNPNAANQVPLCATIQEVNVSINPGVNAAPCNNHVNQVAGHVAGVVAPAFQF